MKKGWLIDALGVGQAVIVGHDWGALVGWHAALLRPDRFRAVIGLSVPFLSRSVAFFDPSAAQPTSVMPRNEDGMFYQLYFQQPGVAEAEFERDVRQTFVKSLRNVPRRAPAGGPVGMVPRGGGFLIRFPSPTALQAWLNEAGIDFYVGEFERTGFRGGFAQGRERAGAAK